MPDADTASAPPALAASVYHFGRLQAPAIRLPLRAFAARLRGAFEVYTAKGGRPSWDDFAAGLYALDLFTAAGCLEGDTAAWDALFAARAHRSDALLVDALRSRAARLYPRDDERQESAVAEFWGQLLVGVPPSSVGILARYDGQRPLVPWLIRVFQNWHVSQLRHRHDSEPLPEADVGSPGRAEGPHARWHETFCEAARDWLGSATDQELLVLGLRIRYRLSQREVARVLGVHEGTVSRQVSHLRDRCLAHVSARLAEDGWSGDDLIEFVGSELGHVLLDDPRLSADALARLLAARGKTPPH